MDQFPVGSSNSRGASSARTDVDARSGKIERILNWTFIAGATGFAVLALQSWTLDDPYSGWKFFSIGALAGIVSAAAGGALGLLFGLPISSRVTVVQGAGDRSSASRASWFSDNTSIEEIADWLTKIIVGLTLTQWSSIQSQFNRVAAAISGAMMTPVTDASPSELRMAFNAMSGDAAMVPGGVIVGAYAIFGFLAVYLWARRYLPTELAAARGEGGAEQTKWEQKYIERVADVGGAQSRPKDDRAHVEAQAVADAAQIEAKTEATTGGANEPRASGDEAAATAETAAPAEPGAEGVSGTPAAPRSTADLSQDGPSMPSTQPADQTVRVLKPFSEIVQPGASPSDPWKGQFGGKSTDGNMAVTASVRPLESDPNLFAAEIKIKTLGLLRRLMMKGQRARIYLHPTFDNAIRVETFGETGEITLPLLGYGAFTVGVQLEDGRLYELDLSQIVDAPVLFRLR